MEIDGKNFMEIGTLKIVLGQMGWIFADNLSNEIKDIYNSSHIVPLMPDFYKKGTVLAVSKIALILADGEPEVMYKIMKFKILRASVRAYQRNLNTHSSYKEFREARANLRNQNEKVTGLKLTQYLDKYSAQGKKYTEILKTTIKKNSLSDFENAKLLSTGLRKEIKL